jgi:polyisoprenoid-binding protein YceI
VALAGTMIRGAARCALLPLGVALAMAALAADSAIDTEQSSIVATFRQENVPIDAQFKRFSGTIAYDAAHPAAASATITIDMTSLDIGDETSDAEVRKIAWFDSTHFPEATFRSTAIRPGAAGHFDASGTLTIKGRAQTITVAISVLHTATATAFEGGFDLSRQHFGIGDTSWDEVLEDNVRVRFHLQGAGT